jgi:hypothetical protein
LIENIKFYNTFSPLALPPSQLQKNKPQTIDSTYGYNAAAHTRKSTRHFYCIVTDCIPWGGAILAGGGLTALEKASISDTNSREAGLRDGKQGKFRANGIDAGSA